MPVFCQTDQAQYAGMPAPEIHRLRDGTLVMVIEAEEPFLLLSPLMVTLTARGTLADTLAFAASARSTAG